MRHTNQNGTTANTSFNRSLRKVASALSASLLLVAGASAQVTPSGPFTGQFQEGFDVVGPVAQGFAANPVFQGNAEYYTAHALQAASWGYGCTMTPRTGSRFMGDIGGSMAIEFNAAPAKFGGYFGSNQPGGPAVVDVRFLDAANNLVTTDSITIHNSCDWQWFGWSFTPTTVRRVEFTYVAYSEHVMMDDLELDFPVVNTCDSMFCFGDGSIASCPCGNNSSSGGCANGTGNGSVLYPMGSCSIAANDAGLAADNLPVNGWALFFEGATTLPGGSMPFVDGLLCVGGPYRGLQFVQAGPSGGAETTVDLVTPPGGGGFMHTAGETTYYQCYYHTPGPYSVCGSSWNLTNGVSRIWTP